VSAEIEDVSFNGAIAFDERVIATVEAAADRLHLGRRRMVSGAGHDARALAGVCPTGMVFIPCAGGISHSETESIAIEHAAAGADVLLQTLLRLDRWSGSDPA